MLQSQALYNEAEELSDPIMQIEQFQVLGPWFPSWAMS